MPSEGKGNEGERNEKWRAVNNEEKCLWHKEHFCLAFLKHPSIACFMSSVTYHCLNTMTNYPSDPWEVCKIIGFPEEGRYCDGTISHIG